MIETLSQMDKELFLWLNGFHYTFLNSIMILFSGKMIWIFPITYFLYLLRESKKSLILYIGCLILLFMITETTSSYVLKNIFNRLRPCRVNELKNLIHQFGQKCGGKYGFVSAHAANSSALIFFSIVKINLSAMTQSLMVSFVLLVCFSRIYLGVHYPGDILGGIFIGLIWSYILVKISPEITEKV